MIAYARRSLRRCVYGPTGYVVPRANGRTLVGATTERAGFESVTTAEGIADSTRTAVEILPSLAGVAPSDAWAVFGQCPPIFSPYLAPIPTSRACCTRQATRGTEC